MCQLPRFPLTFLDILEQYASWKDILALVSIDKREAMGHAYWIAEKSKLRIAWLNEANRWILLAGYAPEPNILELANKCKWVEQVVSNDLETAKWFPNIKNAQVSLSHKYIVSDLESWWPSTLTVLDLRLWAQCYNFLIPSQLTSLKLSSSVPLYFTNLKFPLTLQELELTASFPSSRLYLTNWLSLSSLRNLSLYVDCNNRDWPCNVETLCFTGVSTLQILPLRLQTLSIYPKDYFGSNVEKYTSLLSTAPQLETVNLSISQDRVVEEIKKSLPRIAIHNFSENFFWRASVVE